jgi:acetate kinase
VAVAHRVVHGGTRFSASVRIDDATLAFLESLNPLAPLHQPHNLAGVKAFALACPGIPQVACFDTAFHTTAPEVAKRVLRCRRPGSTRACGATAFTACPTAM